MTVRSIDLNVDIGEGFAHDAALLEFATSANIACGGHAGDVATMRMTAHEAMCRGVNIGAHPGYPDRENFGRIVMNLSPEEIERSVGLQIAALAGIVLSMSGRLTHVKPHGALYNHAEQHVGVANAIVRAVQGFDSSLAIVGLAGGQLVHIARDAGLQALDEAFADRRYFPDGQLVPRSQPGAVIDQLHSACAQAIDLTREGRVQTTDGNRIVARPDTICLHGDGPHAVAFARCLRAEFAEAHILVLSAPGKPISNDTGPVDVLEAGCSDEVKSVSPQHLPPHSAQQRTGGRRRTDVRSS
jgi:5-oxoprolinase (ATP-hydrolysing) subunit A